MAKSSQAARNSRLSSARRSASRRRHSGSTLKNVNFAKVRSAIWVKIAVCGFALGVWTGLGWGSSLNFFGEAEAAVRDSHDEKVQDAPPPTRTPSQARKAQQQAKVTEVTLVLLPRSTSVGELAAAGMSPGLQLALRLSAASPRAGLLGLECRG